MSSGATTTPSIETIRSPARRPAEAAGVPDETAWTVVVAFPAEVMNSPVKRTQGEHDVRRRAGGDRGDPLPRRRPPVGVDAERVIEVVQRSL